MMSHPKVHSCQSLSWKLHLKTLQNLVYEARVDGADADVRCRDGLPTAVHIQIMLLVLLLVLLSQQAKM